ncbi:MAG: hypothetical protein IJ593_06325, partial [Lachnospiraceae bacterium]|nr:hypothetical protein [Lachnospiraceae bacterium]
MKKFIKFIFSFIMFNVLLIAEIACVFGIVTVVKNVKTNKELDEVKNYFTEQQKHFALSEDDIVEHFKNEDSDISGMTQLDKIQAGLTPGDNSDSDGDGLTDKEEIEIYNTDPLKASTDGVTLDYFKVRSDTDIRPTYEVYDNFNLIDLNTGNNMLANIVKIDNCKIDGTDVIDTYAVSDYDGTVEIDVSQYNDNVIF